MTPEQGKGYIVEVTTFAKARPGETAVGDKVERMIALYYGDNEWGSLGSDYQDITIGEEGVEVRVLAEIDPNKIELVASDLNARLMTPDEITALVERLNQGHPGLDPDWLAKWEATCREAAMALTDLNTRLEASTALVEEMKLSITEVEEDRLFWKARLLDAIEAALVSAVAAEVEAVAYLDETGECYAIKGGPSIRALFDALPMPSVGKKVLPLYAVPASAVSERERKLREALVEARKHLLLGSRSSCIRLAVAVIDAALSEAP